MDDNKEWRMRQYEQALESLMLGCYSWIVVKISNRCSVSWLENGIYRFALQLTVMAKDRCLVGFQA